MKINIIILKFIFLPLTVNLLIAIQLHAQSPVFFGMTETGGANGMGAIISFNPTTNAEQVVWSFGSGTDGQYPNGNLTFDDSDGLFYGLTFLGGSDSAGVIFSFNPENNVENVVWNFGNGTDAKMPNASLVYDPDNGLFYGTTTLGGSNDSGTIFSFNQDSNMETAVWPFGIGIDGAFPQGNLAYDLTSQIFWGMTAYGGTNNAGILFSFTPGVNVENVVWSLGNDSDGAIPSGSLVLDPYNQVYYGMTSTGGSNTSGAIVSYNPSSNLEKPVWSFGYGTDGNTPEGDLIYNEGNGLFYGMTENGGKVDEGSIISFNPLTNTDSVLWSFGNGTDGQNPLGNLVYNTANGLYYGMTSAGGVYDAGTIISFNPATDSEYVVWNFDSLTDGNSPNGSLVLYTGPTGIAPVSNSASTISIYPNPGNGTFTITGLNSGQKVELYNYLGRQISGFPADGITQHLDISSCTNGIYLVQVLNADGTVAAEKKLVKIN